MIEIKYVCSNGKEYSLVGDRMRATSGSFHTYKWKQNTTAKEIGDNVYGFSKDSITYSITLTVRGKLAERHQILDELVNAFERDISNMTPGRIYFGTYYIECYIQKAENSVSSTWNNWSDCKADIYCPYPFWIQDITKSFYPDSAGKSEEYGFLGYPYGYDYDYSRPASGSQHWYIDHYKPSNYKMIIYGPCTNPRITINDHVYQVYETLSVTEYIEVDSLNNTVMKYLSNGTVQNIFYKKGNSDSIFTPIPQGDLLVSWNGEFGFDITVYKERSVPEYKIDMNR